MADMNIKFLGGIDKRPYATAAENIENMRYDEHRMCWKNDRSFRSWYNPDVDAVPSGEPSTGNIYSIYSYQRHRSSTQCLLFEELAGSGESLNLKVIIGQSVYTLATNRAVPRGNDPGTSYIKIGKNLFIINGEDPPLLYSGGRRIRTAFFHNTPEAPTPVEVPGTFDDNLGTQTNGDLQLRQRFGKAGINFFDNAGNLGMALAPETVFYFRYWCRVTYFTSFCSGFLALSRYWSGKKPKLFRVQARTQRRLHSSRSSRHNEAPHLPNEKPAWRRKRN
ncbi:MAG: hypothetical protein ACXACE_16295 [Candidatus Thorarchaeota archaeon]|jgi:hypothetical protein